MSRHLPVAQDGDGVEGLPDAPPDEERAVERGSEGARGGERWRDGERERERERDGERER